MPFTSVAKELLISVLSRNKSSEQSVICFLEEFYWLVREPISDCERKTKILCNPRQAWVELGTLGWCTSAALWLLVPAASFPLYYSWMFFFLLLFCSDELHFLYVWLNWMVKHCLSSLHLEFVFCFWFSWTKKLQRWRKEQTKLDHLLKK